MYMTFSHISMFVALDHSFFETEEMVFWNVVVQMVDEWGFSDEDQDSDEFNDLTAFVRNISFKDGKISYNIDFLTDIYENGDFSDIGELVDKHLENKAYVFDKIARMLFLRWKGGKPQAVLLAALAQRWLEQKLMSLQSSSDDIYNVGLWKVEVACTLLPPVNESVKFSIARKFYRPIDTGDTILPEHVSNENHPNNAEYVLPFIIGVTTVEEDETSF